MPNALRGHTPGCFLVTRLMLSTCFLHSTRQKCWANHTFSDSVTKQNDDTQSGHGTATERPHKPRNTNRTTHTTTDETVDYTHTTCARTPRLLASGWMRSICAFTE